MKVVSRKPMNAVDAFDLGMAVYERAKGKNSDLTVAEILAAQSLGAQFRMVEILTAVNRNLSAISSILVVILLGVAFISSRVM